MPSYLLSLESTCDETAAAVIDERGIVLASTVAGQEELHREFEGVVPRLQLGRISNEYCR